jgi:hypothetical protein
MEIRGDDSRGEAVRMQLPDSFVALEDSSIVPIQVSCQASPKPYYIDSSMQLPEVTMGTVVGELNSINKAASLSSNNSEQKMGTVPLQQRPIALDQDLVTEVNRKDMEVVMLDKNIIQDEFEETSNAPGSTDKYKESPRLNSISEVVSSATTKSKEIVVDAEAALCDCAVQNEFQNNPIAIEDNESSRGSGVLETVPCVVVENEVVGIKPAFCKSSV